MAAKIFRINYKSDFILTLNSDAGWMTPFCIKFWTGAPSQAFFAQWDGETYTHCAYDPSEPTKLLVQFDDHHLPIGELKYQVAYHFTVADFPNDTEDEVLNQANITTEIDGETYQVMLDFTGETAPEIQFSLPAYANEAQRIANEQQRITNEEQRIAAETVRIQNEQQRIAQEQIRQQNEQQRINQEQARVNEYAGLKADAVAATGAANDAAALANQKAQLAADKAALAQDASDLANAKAQLAADKAALAESAATLANQKAALAQQKAEYAQEQGTYSKNRGDYAKEQGDYSKAQGDYAKDQGDYSKSKGDYAKVQGDYSKQQGYYAKEQGEICAADHLVAVEDHQTAAADHQTATTDHSTSLSDHTQAGNDHTRAESDHTRAESDHDAVELYVDSLGVFDLSKHNAVGGVLATYVDLSAALTALNALDSQYKYGGMSFKFVQSSDNNYVKFFCTAQNFTTDATKWQGVDDEPSAGSSNLVKSGGVADKFSDTNLEFIKLNGHTGQCDVEQKEGFIISSATVGNTIELSASASRNVGVVKVFSRENSRMDITTFVSAAETIAYAITDINNVVLFSQIMFKKSSRDFTLFLGSYPTAAKVYFVYSSVLSATWNVTGTIETVTAQVLENKNNINTLTPVVNNLNISMYGGNQVTTYDTPQNGGYYSTSGLVSGSGKYYSPIDLSKFVDEDIEITLSVVSSSSSRYTGFTNDISDLTNIEWVDVIQEKRFEAGIPFKIRIKGKYLLVSTASTSTLSLKILTKGNIPSRVYALETKTEFIKDGGDLGIFTHIAVCGDSLSSGTIAYGDSQDESGVQGLTLYWHSWIQYIARKCGNIAYNFSTGGLAARDFFSTTNEMVRHFDSNEYHAQAYFIALGHNDYNICARTYQQMGYSSIEEYIPVYVGSSSDIDLSDYNNNGNSYYGYYGKIIQKIKEKDAHAKIFVVTMMKESRYGAFNVAIRDMANIFTNIYVVDFAKYYPSYPSWHYTQGHGNAQGYRAYSEMMATLCQNIISEHRDLFTYTALINTEAASYIPANTELSVPSDYVAQ